MLVDCLERMKEIPDCSVDMILTDPPYVLSKSKGGGMMGKDGRVFIEQVDSMNMCKSNFDVRGFLENVKHCLRKVVTMDCSFVVLNSYMSTFLLP